MLYMLADTFRYRPIADRLLNEFNKLPKPKRSNDTFALGGGYHIKDQNCQHFTVYLTLRLLSRAKKRVEKDHLIQLVWGKIEAQDKYDRISREIQYGLFLPLNFKIY